MPASIVVDKKVEEFQKLKIVTPTSVVKMKKSTVLEEKAQLTERYVNSKAHWVPQTRVRHWQKLTILFRLLTTLPLLFACRLHPLWMIGALQVTDMFDHYVMKLAVRIFYKKWPDRTRLEPYMKHHSWFYQRSDKMLDVFFYLVAIYLLQTYSYCFAPKWLWGLFIWRLLGVICFCKTKSRRALIFFVDLVKEMILLHELIAMNWIHMHTVTSVALVVVAKYAFEFRYHRSFAAHWAA